jgi:hypothetical protein
MCRNFLAQLSGATLAHTRSLASRAHSSAARTTSSQPSGAGSYFEQLSWQVSNELLGHLVFTLSHISKHTACSDGAAGFASGAGSLEVAVLGVAAVLDVGSV